MPPWCFRLLVILPRKWHLEARTVVDVALKSELTDLDEVVVVGYSTQKRANVVGSVTSISGSSIRKVPSSSVQLQLQAVFRELRYSRQPVNQETLEPRYLYAAVVQFPRTIRIMTDFGIQDLLLLLMVYRVVQWMRSIQWILHHFRF